MGTHFGPVMQVNEMTTILNSFVSFIGQLAVPGAVLSIILILASIVVSPFLPEWGQGMKSSMTSIVLALVAIGFAPGLIRALAALVNVGQ